MMKGSPTAGFSPRSSFPRPRESRFVLSEISLDTRLRGYDGKPRSPCELLPFPYPYFRKESSNEHPDPKSFIFAPRGKNRRIALGCSRRKRRGNDLLDRCGRSSRARTSCPRRAWLRLRPGRTIHCHRCGSSGPFSITTSPSTRTVSISAPLPYSMRALIGSRAGP